VNSLNSFKSHFFKFSEKNFDDWALQLFRIQARENSVYRNYLDLIHVHPDDVKDIWSIPFMPIGFFKQHQVKSGEFKSQKIFESSGTTGNVTSKHHVEDIQFYEKVTEAAFNRFYGPLRGYHIIGLLPSYLERENASLVHMVSHFIKKSGSAYSGFYLRDYDRLHATLRDIETADRKTIIIGVTFALMELAEFKTADLGKVIIMETGGMKGNRPEITREEVHNFLTERLFAKKIHAEYGMTELHSQAYSSENGWFYPPPWMKVMIRDINDPFAYRHAKNSGGVNIIDLANIYSCAFIESQDIGLLSDSGGFRILGRLDNSDVRGCNLMLHF
jgi:hypothetical protein